MMKNLLIVILAVIAVVYSQTVVQVGVAKVQGTVYDSGIVGFVYFTELSDGTVNVTVNVTGITVNPGQPHGIHIHQYGDLTTNNGSSVGAHWNPAGVAHGCPPSDVRHLGDTGNWDVSADGAIHASKTLDMLALTGTNSTIGYAVIVHSATDDCSTVASSALRLAQGVIGIANPTYHGATVNNALPATSYGSLSDAVCIIQPASGSNVGGWVRFTQINSEDVRIWAEITGITGQHGLHLHQWGDISLADATSAGSHYTGATPNASQVHGIPNLPRHTGDLGNVYFYDNGVAYYSNVISNTFSIWGGNSPILGRAVVVHNAYDDCTAPIGNSGSRIGVCVIGSANSYWGGSLAFPSGLTVPTFQNTSSCSTNAATSGATTGTTSEQSSSSFAVAVIPSFLLAVIALIFA